MPTNVTHPLVVSGCSSAFLSEKYRRGGVSDMPAAEVLAQICATGAASPTRRATGRATAARTAWRDAMARMLCPRRAGKPSPPALSQRAARAGIASRPAACALWHGLPGGLQLLPGTASLDSRMLTENHTENLRRRCIGTDAASECARAPATTDGRAVP